MIRRFAPALLTLLLLAPAPASAQSLPGDYVSSDNIERVGSIRTVGDGVGATVVGNRLFVTSTLGLSVFDITNGETPVQLGMMTFDVEWENEEVPTNGKILGISASTGCKDVATIVGEQATDCLNIYDVSDASAPQFLKSVKGAGDHTSACVLECTWFYGSSGTITDARNPSEAKLAGNWFDAFPEGFIKSCHHVREVAPGYILGSCVPAVFMSVMPQDGGSPEKPALIAIAPEERFVHSSQWPRQGRDRFMLTGGEQNATPDCGDENVGVFQVWDAKAVLAPAGWNFGTQFVALDEVAPSNGNFVDGRTPVNALGCSVHWFQHHPTFRNGGVVALAEYENGTRILQITPEGKIVEQGFFLPLAGSTSAPHWHPNGKVIYNIDYARGVDVLRYTGETYVPAGSGDVASTGATAGTAGEAASCATAAGFTSVSANPLANGLRFNVAKRQDRAFDVEVFRQSSGRSVLGNKLVARFRNKTESFDWIGKDSRGRFVGNGYYFVRFTMHIDGETRDVRRVTMLRSRGAFRRVRDFQQRVDCGPFADFKLSSAVFGGRSSAALKIAYRLAAGAERVTVEARVGKKLVKRFRGGTRTGPTYRFRLPARLVKRGQTVRVRATVRDAQGAKHADLYSKRL